MRSDSSPITQSKVTRYLGLDVGGTKIEAGVVTAAGELLAANAVEAHFGGSREQVLADIHAAFEPLRSEPVAGLGVGFPSFGDYDQGILDSELSGYPAMNGFPLRQHLEGAYGLPVKTIPDANLFAHGIQRFGEGQQFTSFIAIALGTESAIALVKDGEIQTGPKGFPESIMRCYTVWGLPAMWRHSGYQFATHYGADEVTSIGV